MRYVGLLLITVLICMVPLPVISAEPAVVTVSAVVLSKNQCKFSTKTATLDFGSLNPKNPIVQNASTTISFTCRGSDAIASYLVTEDGGLASYKMTHVSNSSYTIPYTLTLTPSSGSAPRNTGQTLTISGVVQGVDYQGVLPGLYADTVIVTLDP